MKKSQKSTNKNSISLFTIGYNKKSAKEFFERLQDAGVRRVFDIRLGNTSHLAGFTKKRDLQYFLQAINNMGYFHQIELAPTEEIFRAYKKTKEITWEKYEIRFKQILENRAPTQFLDPVDFDRACLLCSEPTPEHCHRRLVAEHLKEKWKNVEIIHL